MKSAMNISKYFLTVLTLSILIQGCTQSPSPSTRQTTPQTQKTSKAKKAQKISKAIPDDSTSRTTFGFDIGSARYLFHKNGIGEKVSANGEKQPFRLPIDSYDEITRVHYFFHNNNLGILYDFTDGASGGASLLYLNPTTLEQRWILELPTYHTGESLLIYPYVYLTAMGFAAKVDLEQGKIVWKHDDLYKPEKGGFREFGTPEQNGDVIEFPLKDSPEPYLIQIEDQTGKIIEVVK